MHTHSSDPPGTARGSRQRTPRSTAQASDRREERAGHAAQCMAEVQVRCLFLSKELLLYRQSYNYELHVF